MDYVMSKYILPHCYEEEKSCTALCVTHKEVQNQTQLSTLKQRKILFIDESFTLGINM